MSRRVPRRRARAPVAVAPAAPAPLAVSLLVALAVPRLVRILYPAVWVEDDLLLESAFAVSKGLRPYLDFAHAQMPLLEWVAGFYIRLVGASHVRMEILNALAIYATSVLTFCVGRRAVDARAATAASLLYAWHSLVFRYHVWAREYFVSALVLGAVLLVAGERRASWRRATTTAATLLFLACAIKLTAIVSAAALCIFVAAGQRAIRRALVLAAVLTCELGAFVTACWWRYGGSFFFQAFLFHFLKGVDPGAGPAYLASLLDVLGPLALLGAWHLHRTRRWNHTLGMVSSVLAADLLFFCAVSPTAWGHNFLEAWPFVAILAGTGVTWFIDAWPRSPVRLGTGVAVVAVCLIWITPLDNESDLRNSHYGFGFIARRELDALASALNSDTAPGEQVLAPAFIAFEANRLQAVRYPENYGVMTAADDLRRSTGFWQARAQFGGRSFFELIDQTSDIWNREVVRDLAPGGPVNAMIPDSPIELLPLVNASPAALEERGFHPALRSEHFALWLRAAGTPIAR
jgi:hypothetical protein